MIRFLEWRCRRHLTLVLAVVSCLAASAMVTSCSSDPEPSVSDGQFPPRFEPPEDARRGGEMTMLAAGDIGPLDPGALINQSTFMINFATQRTVLTVPADGRSPLMPDLAAEMPEVDRQGGTIGVRIRPDVWFSPPVDRPVVAADVKYAIERSLLPGVASSEVVAYLGELVGFPAALEAARENPGRAPRIDGIRIDGPDHLTFEFSGVVPPLAVSALSLSVTAPVPPGYARKFDRTTPSSYGSHVVATGPYRVEAEDDGRVTGYEPGVSIELVRNTSWRPESDFRPAYLDRITVESGYNNAQLASNKILDGSSMMNVDFSAGSQAARRAIRESPDQLSVASMPATLYAALNTTIEPFDDVNVRRAVLAATDRQAMRLAHGGELAGGIATHFLPPGVRGFEQAGGPDGPGFDFLARPEGDPELAARYMRRAGYETGRYEGPGVQLMVADNTTVGRRVGEIMRQGLESVGIEVEVRTVSRDTMYSSFCNVPAAEVAVCPNVGWFGLFGDGQSMLEVAFQGRQIRSINNSNWSQLDDPDINRQIEHAKRIPMGAARTEAWAAVDRSVTSLAPAVPIIWPNLVFLNSENVVSVIDRGSSIPALPMISLTDPCEPVSGDDC